MGKRKWMISLENAHNALKELKRWNVEWSPEEIRKWKEDIAVHYDVFKVWGSDVNLYSPDKQYKHLKWKLIDFIANMERMLDVDLTGPGDPWMDEWSHDGRHRPQCPSSCKKLKEKFPE